MRLIRLAFAAAVIASPLSASAQEVAPPAAEADPAASNVEEPQAGAEADDDGDTAPTGIVRPAGDASGGDDAKTAPAEVADHEPATVPDVDEGDLVSDDEDQVGVAWNRGTLGEDYPWTLDIGGYIRVGYVGIQDDPTGTFGRNDGFAMGNARLTLEGTMRDLGFKLQLDGAVNENVDANDANAVVVTRLRDAYLAYRPFDFVGIAAGQFKPPFDIEEQFSTARLLFANRSVGSRGVSDVEGRNVEGLSVDRQVGIEVGTPGWFFLSDDNSAEGPGVSYSIALTNGQPSNRALNDNEKLAGFGRLALHWADIAAIGGAYSINPRSLGVPPDVIDEDVTAWTADATFQIVGLSVIGSVIGQTIARPDVDGGTPETSALAYQAQIAYREPFLGFQPAIRYAYFDPAERADDVDALTHITFGLNYLPPYPVRLMLNYTITQESEELALPNNRFDAVLQVTW